MKSKLILMTALAAVLSTAGLGMAQAPAPGTPDQTKTNTKAKVAATNPAPTAQEIADAKAKNMVWVNMTTRVYHKDGQFYGATKRGKFMTEDDAKQAGFKAAKESPAKKTKTTSKS